MLFVVTSKMLSIVIQNLDPSAFLDADADADADLDVDTDEDPNLNADADFELIFFENHLNVFEL